MIEIKDVIDMANFYEISEFDLFYLAFLWCFARIPDFQILKRDFNCYITEKKIPFYVRQFVRENPLIDDNGSIVEVWLPVLEALRNEEPKDIYFSTWTTLAKREAKNLEQFEKSGQEFCRCRTGGLQKTSLKIGL